VKRVESAARYVNLFAGAAVVVGVFVQIYLIASFIFGDSGALSTHETNGDIVVAFELVAFLSALVGWRRASRTQLWLSVALFLVGAVQVSLAKDVGDSPGVHALHGVFALVVVLLASAIVARALPVLFSRPAVAS
jgi:hypothetical protein